MGGRAGLYKIIGIIILFLVFLQYLSLFPTKLNFPRRARLGTEHTSLFNIKTAAFYKVDITEHPPPPEVRQNAPSAKNYTTTPKPMRLHSTRDDDSVKASSSNSSLPACPSPSPLLQGPLKVNLSHPPTFPEISKLHPDLVLGGLYTPPTCTSPDAVAIIVPFRDREDHLRLFLYNLLPFLKRQLIQFNIFILEQGGSNEEPFNRAMLFNVGFREALKRFNFSCFIFHDVDLIPENDYNIYNCPSQPRHMSVAVDKMRYRLPYRTLFGGISALSKEHFERVNGFSNSFWGWGAEDDDMAGRIAYNGLYISRPPPTIARYKMLKHKPQKLNGQRHKVLQKGKTRFKSDGLNNLKYGVEQVRLEQTYTLIRVKLEKV